MLSSFPADGTIVRVKVSNMDINGMINSTSLSTVLVTRVVRTGLTGAPSSRTVPLMLQVALLLLLECVVFSCLSKGIVSFCTCF